MNSCDHNAWISLHDLKGRKWPGEDRHFYFKPRASGTADTVCASGTQVCYGAEDNDVWRFPRGRRHWGVGLDGSRRGCKDCCYSCSAASTNQLLQVRLSYQ